MPSPHDKLENLVKTGVLKREPPEQEEIDGLLLSGGARITDAEKESNSLESRFDLAYNAAHAFSLAALRHHGYRPDRNRYVVFQTLPHTVNLPTPEWRVLDSAHTKRNRTEYEGASDVDKATVDAVIRAAREVEKRVIALGSIVAPSAGA
jgi:hypothetical protein